MNVLKIMPVLVMQGGTNLKPVHVWDHDPKNYLVEASDTPGVENEAARLFLVSKTTGKMTVYRPLDDPNFSNVVSKNLVKSYV